MATNLKTLVTRGSDMASPARRSGHPEFRGRPATHAELARDLVRADGLAVCPVRRGFHRTIGRERLQGGRHGGRSAPCPCLGSLTPKLSDGGFAETSQKRWGRHRRYKFSRIVSSVMPC